MVDQEEQRRNNSHVPLQDSDSDLLQASSTLPQVKNGQAYLVAIRTLVNYATL